MVALGGQFLNTGEVFENYATFTEERQRLLDRLDKEGFKNVVFLTGDQDPERQLEVLEHGADDYILKPVRPRHLIAAVQSRVRRARAASSRIAVSAEPERHPVTGLFTRPALMATASKAPALL